MKNKLPENWDGTFFKEEEASKIINMTAVEFANSLMKNNSKDAKFFLAGAIFDLEWHGLTEKAAGLIKTASEMFEAPYEVIPEWISSGKKHIESGIEEQKVKSIFYRLIGETFEDQKGIVLDLRICAIGMSCKEYTILAIAGPFRKDLPSSIIELMEQHEEVCSCHQSKAFHQFAISAPVTEALEQAARQIIEKYSK